MHAKLRIKLLSNLGANAYGQLITIAIQLVSVPLYLHYWGVELYGEWLILSAIPAYLTLSDIGLGSVAANDMTMRVAQGDKQGALEVYQSIWLFISGVSVAVGLTLTLLIYALPANAILSLIHINEKQTQQTLTILMLWVFVGLQGNILNAAFRSVGRYAYGTAMGNNVRLAEWLASLLVLLMGGGVQVTALANLATRLIGMTLLWLVLRKQVPWLYHGIKVASIQQVRTLFKPAVAFMAFPLGFAFSSQGMVLMIGMMLGSTAVVIFSTYRTLTRLLLQFITMLNHAVWPAVSEAYGAKQMNLVTQLHRQVSFLTFWIALIGVTLLGIFGEWFINIWTRHAFNQNSILFLFLLAATFLNVLWQPSLMILMATNQHQKTALAFLASTASGLMFSFLAMQEYGIVIIGFVLTVCELPILYAAVRNALVITKASWRDYYKSIFRFPFELPKYIKIKQ